MLRSAIAITFALFALVSLLPAETQTPKKKSAPRPEPEATPRPKKKSTPEPEDITLKPVKKSTPSPEDDATPRPKKKTTPAPENDEATPRPKKSAPRPDDESTPKPVKKSTPKPADTDTPEPDDQATPKPKATPSPERAPNASIEPEDLVEFSALPARIQDIFRAALALTQQGLTYTFGSSDPAQGGMDCSGTMYYLLRSAGFTDVPRDSSSQYAWARKAGGFRAVVSKSADSFEFDELLPGDLLFWTGTYETGREIPISHVMLYLGTEKKTKRRVMFGASDGRTYHDVQRWGVSVFDFKMPKADPANPAKARVDFVGYARIPGLRDGVKDGAPVVSEPATPAPEPKSTPSPKPKGTPSAKKKRTG